MADELGLAERIEAADVVVTGEGFLDEESFEGKVVGGVATMAARAGRPVVAIVGEVLDGVTLPPISTSCHSSSAAGGRGVRTHGAAIEDGARRPRGAGRLTSGPGGLASPRGDSGGGRS